ncbi:hypothetical protein MNBD_GAMMA03-691 [hydrothermal vent metagenome]|uniref:DUF72 domain-containing protein n=1 Tax=hydrothermal vent metagenome TaxID=652676 RepID=A0A3B0WB78_9ZZZZ
MNVQIGTYGWQNDAWLSTFYPNDLPEDWRLDFFSNIYRVVLVPQVEWQAWSKETLLDIVECVDHEFGIYLAIQVENEDALENVQLLDQLNRILSVLGTHVLGFVIWSEVVFTQLKFLQRPVTLVSTQYYLSGWRWRSNRFWVSGNPLGWVDLLPEDGKVQAELLRSFMGSLAKIEKKQTFISVLPFIVGGEKINMEHVANLKTIGELLGY